jgi:outer membrane protein OmpA-like peptidoglycan-associated protein
MARFASYPATPQIPGTRRWLLRALILSLGFHVIFLIFAYWKRIENFAFTPEATLAPPQFVAQRVVIDPKTLEQPEETRVKLPATAPKPEELSVPTEKPVMKDIVLKPSVQEVDSPLLKENSQPQPINWDKVMKADANSAGAADKDLGAIASALLKDTVAAPRQPIVKVNRGTGDGADAWEGIAGRQSLDAALERTGPLPEGGVPIALPGGALFDYDKAELRSDAIDEMQKLAELLRRNPNATFRIEGHTDALGGRDYNLELSLRRAEAVKAWLVQALKIDPARIETVGFGPDKLLVPGDRSIEEQQPNRRVEIVIKANRR